MAQLQKYGPYGNQDAIQNFSFMLEGSDRITEVVVRSGFIVDAIGFTVTDANGIADTNMFGGNGGSQTKIGLQMGEYIIGISGRTKNSFISKLRIHTNLHPRGHGPYGTDELRGGHDIKFLMPVNDDDSIVGFFGTAQKNLVSLGFYVKKHSQDPEKYGPFGYQTGQSWFIMFEPCENLSEIIIKTGALVDSITFITTKARQKFGGDGGNAEHKIKLQSSEYVTNISGWIGEWHENRDLTKLKIHTNLRKDGYGPYGGGPHTNYLSEFRSQVPSDGRVVGFFGTIHKNYIESIGLYVQK